MPLLWYRRIVINHNKVKGWNLTPSHFTGQNLVDIWLDECGSAAPRYRLHPSSPDAPSAIRELVNTREEPMLPSQRALFDIPREVCYLNAAAWSPLPLAVQEAGRAGVARKGQPWLLDQAFRHRAVRARPQRRRALIGADPGDVALISSVGYGVATAAKVLAVPRGPRVLVLQDDHSSPVLEWMTRAAERRLHGRDGAAARRRRLDGGRAGGDRAARAPPRWRSPRSPRCTGRTAASSISTGSPRRCAPQGAALLVDATHGAGVLAIDVRTLDPDFLIFPTYKWVLGPYGRAFLYVAKRHQEKAAAGADELRAARRARRAVHLLRRHALRRRRPALRHGRARPFHLAGDGRRSAWR